MTATDQDINDAATAFARDMAGFWQDRLGPRLLGVYLLGSLAHGGFNRRYSDIDLGVIAEDGLSGDERDAMVEASVSLSPELAPKLSLFWTDRNFSIGRFPPLDRVDYLDHSAALVEAERIEPERPSIDDIRSYLRGAPFETWARRAKDYAALENLDPANHKPYLRAHLYPARFIFSWMTGRMESNDIAVAYLHDNRPAGLDLELVTQALQCRHDAADPDQLFPARTSLPGQVDACARLMDG